MTAKQLIEKLKEYPPESIVKMEVLSMTVSGIFDGISDIDDVFPSDGEVVLQGLT